MVEGKILWFDALGSTNDEAWSQVHEAGIEAVAAHHQTAGRGRAGRSWASPAGAGLYLSWICRPHMAREQGTLLPLAIAVATAEVCESQGCPVRLKWPNDILYDGRKLAGILCEARTLQDRWTIVVGIGINLHRPQSGWEGVPGGIALAETPWTPIAKATLAERLVAAFGERLRRLEAQGARDLLGDWQSRGPRLGTPMTHGGRNGTYAGLGPDGGLRLTVGGIVETIHAGDVHLIDQGD